MTELIDLEIADVADGYGDIAVLIRRGFSLSLGPRRIRGEGFDVQAAPRL